MDTGRLAVAVAVVEMNRGAREWEEGKVGRWAGRGLLRIAMWPLDAILVGWINQL